MSIAQHAADIGKRITRMVGIVTDLEAHLIGEQAAALMERKAAEAGMPGTSGTSDPTGSAVTNAIDHKHSAYTRSGQRRAALVDALNGIARAIDHTELTVRNCISDTTEFDTTDIERCAGWTVELRARLGGCGNHLSTYVRKDGTTGERQLCDRCRTAESRASRAGEPDEVA